ncbi:MAG: sulfur oxidation c-type cytochrome SoxX [Gammaproteobacteria bacterium]
MICRSFVAALLISESFSVYGEQLSGKQLAFDQNKGNCLACHAIDDGDSPGDIGPPLRAMASRFKDKQQLRAQLWDATQFNPETSMPPFGKNKILSDAEIDAIVDYLWTLP